jgi:coenzyme F420-reducing hydrogenase delta subunit
MYIISAGMGGRFAEICREMNDKIKELGPSPIRIAKGKAPRPLGEVTA